VIPKNITKEHILRAIEDIKRTEVPAQRTATKFLLEYEGMYFPAKYVISLANRFANGKMLDSESFSGGKETNEVLRKMGFKIENLITNVVPTQLEPPIKFEKEASIRHNNERCKNCKATIAELLKENFGEIKRGFTFELGTKPEDFANTAVYNELKEIYQALQKFRGYEKIVRTGTLPKGDFLVPNPGFIVEIDEVQHFTLQRKLALEMYPKNLKLGFCKEKWIERCASAHAIDHDKNTPFRDEQRAWYDTIRDFLPRIRDLKPTVRLMSRDYVWCKLSPENRLDIQKFRDLLNLQI
jgi:hypothetical protein